MQFYWQDMFPHVGNFPFNFQVECTHPFPACRMRRLKGCPDGSVGLLVQQKLYSKHQIVFTIFRLIWIQTNIRLDPNQTENSKYNLISVSFDKISKRCLRVCCRIFLKGDRCVTLYLTEVARGAIMGYQGPFLPIIIRGDVQTIWYNLIYTYTIWSNLIYTYTIWSNLLYT